MTESVKRLQSELMQLMMSGANGVSAFPKAEENWFEWSATIQGPSGSAYENLSFRLGITFPPNYPYAPPVCTFVTRCWHPNVDLQGNICLDILKDNWSAVYSVQSILLSLQSLLGEPNNQSALNIVAAEQWDNQAAFKRQVLRHYRH